MAELFEAAQPFEISSPVIFDVPPQTAQSNVISDQKVNQYSIRPDRQFIRQNALSSAIPARSITNAKSFFITKIILSGDTTNSSPGVWIYLDTAQGAALVETIATLRYGTNTTVFKTVYDLDFNPPLFINTQNGAVSFRLTQVNLNAADVIQYTVIGFFVD